MKKIILISIITLFLLILIILIFLNLKIMNNSIQITNQSNLNINTLISFNNSLNRSGFRNIKLNPKWYDKFLKIFYNKIIIENHYFLYETRMENIIYTDIYYPVVKNTSGLVRIKNNQEKLLFKKFLKTEKKSSIQSEQNIVSNENNFSDIGFITIDKLSMDKRILLKNHSAKPIFFYKNSTYKILNYFNQRKYKIENKINHKPDKIIKPVILGFTGDFVIEEFVKESIKINGYDFTLNEVNKILETPDIMSINLEFTVSHRGKRENKHFAFRASENEFGIITNSSIDFAACANNHAMDYGEISLIDTINFLDKYNIYHSGSGINIEEAFSPARLDINNNKLSYFSICKVPDETTGYKVMKKFSASKNKAGIAYYDEKLLKKLFKKEKKAGRLVIVQFHTGKEYHSYPSEYYKRIIKTLIDAGADSVICHHPHVINGIEIFNNKLIAYSLGDFLLDIQKINADEGIIIYLYVYNNKILSWSFYPTICHHGAVLQTENRLIDVEKKFIYLTNELENE